MLASIDPWTATNMAAILLSPLIAVLVSIWLQRHHQKRDRQLYILTTLYANRHAPISEACVQALHAIDIAFSQHKRVRQLWREYYEMLGNVGLNNPTGFQQRHEKNRDLIHAMAKSLGYRGTITHSDMQRIYVPEGMGKAADRQQEIANELLRVLKASGGVSVVPKSSGASS